jgi:hypothetical protein
MTEKVKIKNDPPIDFWQMMKRDRMKFLLDEIQELGEVEVSKFLGLIAVKYGIRKATGEEYINDWINAGCITVVNNIIRFVKKLEDEATILE